MTRGNRAGTRAERARLAVWLAFERILWTRGVRHVAGVDEAGIGPLAGPVVAAAVILPPGIDLVGIDDSKRLQERERERLEALIRGRALGVAVAELGVEEIDRRNIYHAGLEAMRRSVLALSPPPEHVLVDARTIPGLGELPQNAFEKGDATNYSIACASIVAKVARDRRMAELEREYPGYGFARHKGYGTAEHVAAIRRLGPSPVHRLSFPVLAQILGQAGSEFDRLKAALDAAASPAELDGLLGAIAASGLRAAEVHKLRTLLIRRRRKLERAER